MGDGEDGSTVASSVGKDVSPLSGSGLESLVGGKGGGVATVAACGAAKTVWISIHSGAPAHHIRVPPGNTPCRKQARTISSGYGPS